MSAISLNAVERRVLEIIYSWTQPDVFVAADERARSCEPIVPVCRFLILAVYRDWSKREIDSSGITRYTDREDMDDFNIALGRLRHGGFIRSARQTLYPTVHRRLPDGRTLKIVHSFPPPGLQPLCQAELDGQLIWSGEVHGPWIDCFEITPAGAEAVAGSVPRASAATGRGKVVTRQGGRARQRIIGATVGNRGAKKKT